MAADNGVSIIVPTCGRVPLVNALLTSIAEDSSPRSFAVEVILADSSQTVERDAIIQLAASYGAIVVPSPAHNPGLARNAGVAVARYQFLLFVDSDVALCRGAIQAHYDVLVSGADACAGLVEFSGRPTSAWRAVAAMQLMLPFRYPLVSETVPWAPTANVSFCKMCFLKAGGFDATLPPFGGEDVDLGFRFTKAGFGMRTSARAVVRHTVETWAHWSQNLPRLFSYGKADFYLIERHPDRTYADVPSPLLAFLLQILLAIVSAPFMGAWCLVCLGTAVLAHSLCYARLKRTRGESIWIHLPGPLILILLDLGKSIEALKNGQIRPFWMRLRYLDDIIEHDWREIRASVWGAYTSTCVFLVVLMIELLWQRSR